MSCHAKKYRKIKGIEQSEYPRISRKDTPYYLKKPALLARLLALAVGERSAFAWAGELDAGFEARSQLNIWLSKDTPHDVKCPYFYGVVINNRTGSIIAQMIPVHYKAE